MPLYRYRALANGLKTDHPIPDLPFVDDSHIPVDDPVGIESIGRHEAEDSWGREDRVRHGPGWVAFTTDQAHRDLAWCVRWHPKHGRSVVVYHDEEAASVHMAWQGPWLLFRSGGYWWDGGTWYRPAQVWDGASQDYVRRSVPAAATVTAADLLDNETDKDRASVLDIGDIGPGLEPPARWIDHLALWASRRDSASLHSSVVTLAAPELTGDQLVGLAELAEIAGVAPSTLRAYIARGEGDVPPPQATIGRRSVWARPVAEEWAEQRRRSVEGVRGSVSVNRPEGPLPSGVSDVWDRFSRNFVERLSNPQWRKRWALRWRTHAAIEDAAHTLAWDVASSINQIVPTADLSATIRHAVLDELARCERPTLHRFGEDGDSHYWIGPSVIRMLDWLIRHNPSSAGYTIGEIVGEAQQTFQIPREATEEAIRTSLALESKLASEDLADFLGRVMMPE